MNYYYIYNTVRTHILTTLPTVCLVSFPGPNIEQQADSEPNVVCVCARVSVCMAIGGHLIAWKASYYE